MKRDPRAASLLLAPSLVLLVVLFYLPQVLLFVVSLGHRSAYGGVVRTLSLENYARALEPLYLGILWRSLGLAAFTTIACLALGFPFAWWLGAPRPRPLAQRPARARHAAVLDELPGADVRVDLAAALGGAREPRAGWPRAAARGAALQRLRRAGGPGLRRAAVHDRAALRLAREARPRARRGRRGPAAPLPRARSGASSCRRRCRASSPAACWSSSRRSAPSWRPICSAAGAPPTSGT